MSCAEMTSKVGVAHKISRALTRAVYLAPSYIHSMLDPPLRLKGSKERPNTCKTAFDFEQFRHIPYMDISSSGESPFLVAAHTCETSATYCVLTCTERVLLFRARDATSRIVNITIDNEKH